MQDEKLTKSTRALIDDGSLAKHINGLMYFFHESGLDITDSIVVFSQAIAGSDHTNIVAGRDTVCTNIVRAIDALNACLSDVNKAASIQLIKKDINNGKLIANQWDINGKHPATSLAGK